MPLNHQEINDLMKQNQVLVLNFFPHVVKKGNKTVPDKDQKLQFRSKGSREEFADNHHAKQDMLTSIS